MQRLYHLTAALAILGTLLVGPGSGLVSAIAGAEARERRGNTAPPQRPQVIIRDRSLYGPPPPVSSDRNYYGPAPGIQQPMQRVPPPAPLAQPPINR